MTIFTYATGIISVLGFFLQLKDVFPKHKEARKTILLLVTGAFFGSIIISFQSVRIDIELPESPVLFLCYVLLASLGVLLFIVAIVALSTREKERRDVLDGYLGSGTFLFFILLIAIGMMSTGSDPKVNQLTLDEIIILSNHRLGERNYDRAILLLEMAANKMGVDDPRRTLLREQIDSIKVTQVHRLSN
jgi:multisubunit Na+/H+ antiporter MnhG subunit